MPPETSMRQDIAAAIEGAEAPEGTAEAEAPEGQTPAPDASDGGQPEGTNDDGEGAPEAPEGTDDTPTEYFGFDLSGVEPEQRAAFIAELQKRDDYIGKLLRDKEPAPAGDGTPPVEQPEPEFPSDEELLRSLGLDPENPFDVEQGKLALPLAKQQIQQQQALSALVEQQELANLDRYWRDSLSGLEREFGTLPKTLDHERVMEFAAENGIGNPLDAYWRIVGPGRDALSKSLETERARVAKVTEAKRAATGTRPAAVEAPGETLPEAVSTRGATREVARKLLEGLGLDT